MAERTSSVKSAPRESAAKRSPDRNPPATSAPQTAASAGNLALQRLAAPRLQRKARVSNRGDAYEQEADRVSQNVLSLISAPTLQRKCACSGEGECDECKRHAAVQRADIHRKTDDVAVQRVPSGEETPGTTAAAGTADNSAANAPAATPASSPGLIVEDNLTDLGTGQMKKSEFLGQLRGPVSTAAVAGLQGTVWSSMGTVAIEPWFLYYSRQSAQQLERSIQQSVPESGGIISASAYIPLVSSRVQAAVGEWARTGKVPAGVPSGLPGIGLPGAGVLSTVSSLAQSAGDALSSVGSAIGGAVSGVAQGAQDVASSIGSGISSAAQGIGGAISDIGGMLFKAKDGGAHNAADPRAIQSQLGSGESLDDSLQSRMSSAFGHDFSSVRVHKDNRAAQLSSDLNARAFTIGNTVAFGANEYHPGTLVGDALIAHELAHVVQQGGATAPAPLQKGESETGALEDDADFSAVRAVTSLWTGVQSGLANVSHNAIPALRSGLKLQRCVGCSPSSPPPTPAPPTPAPPTFDQYRDQFNKLWSVAPFAPMSAAIDPTLDSRGPRTPKARAIFAKILGGDPAMVAAYTANTGGIRDRIDNCVGPEGLNLIGSPRLDALKKAFDAHAKPVSAADYPLFRSDVAAAAAALTAADRGAVEKSNDWQRLIDDYVKSEANRADIRTVISPPPPAVPVPVGPAPPAVGPTPAQRAHFLSTWKPNLQYWNGQRLTPWSPGSTVRYYAGAQNFQVNAALPASQTNPGLDFYASAQVMRGATPLLAPPPQTIFPPGQNATAWLPVPILAPATVPPAGDPLSFKVDMLEPAAAGAMTSVGAKSINLKALKEKNYTQAQAELRADEDEKYLHDSSPTGFLGKMIASGGIAANVAGAIAAGQITLHALTVRHDSEAFVTLKNGAPDPNSVGYFAGSTYAANSFVEVVGAGGLTLASGEIVVNRTADAATSTRRKDPELTDFIIHESRHHLDVRPSTTIEDYKTEFRAYWMEGRFGPPNSPTCAGVKGACFDTTYDPTMPPPGPKSPRARAIFDHLYGSASYRFVRTAYDDNTAGFREEVDSYLIPDGINLLASPRLEALRKEIEGWGGAAFPTFQATVRAYMGIGAPPAGGALNPDDRAEITRSRAWRDLVERKVTNSVQQTQIKSDLGIPI